MGCDESLAALVQLFEGSVAAEIDVKHMDAASSSPDEFMATCKMVKCGAMRCGWQHDSSGNIYA